MNTRSPSDRSDLFDLVEVQCPYCFERVEVALESDVWGELVMDCEVCCNPWQVKVTRDDWGDPDVKVERSE